MSNETDLENISKDTFRSLQSNGNRRENQTCDGPYAGLAKYVNQGDVCHQYEHLQLSDIKLQEDVIHRGHPNPDLSNTYLTPNVKALKDSHMSGNKNAETDGNVYNTIDETRKTANKKSSSHRICCLIVITVVIVAALVAGSVTAAVVLLNKNKNDIKGEVVDCGQYNDLLVNIKYNVSKGATTFNSSLKVTCMPGLAHSNWSNTSVRCGAEGVWEGKPDCIIPGFIEFSESEYEFTIGTNGSFRCDVTRYPNWQHVHIMKSSGDTILAIFDAYRNTTGNYINVRRFHETRYTLLYNYDDSIVYSLIIDVEFINVKCDAEDTYFCQLVVGNYADTKVANTSVYVRANSSKPKIMVPVTLFVTRDYVVTCSGNVGRNRSGTFGQIALESRENGSGNFTILARGNYTDCDGAALMTVNLTAIRYYKTREFRCKIEDTAGKTIYSEVVNRTLIDSFGDSITGYRFSTIGIPSEGLLEVNIPGFCDWGPVRYISRYNWRDPLDDMICQHFGYTNESAILPKSKSPYPDACMYINWCSTSNMTTIDDIPKQCDVVYGPPTSDYNNLYKEINCIPAQLVDGASKLQGRVEAGLFGQLKSICSLGFDSRAANVICASLGYKRGATQLWTNSYFGSGSRSIYKRNITCSGNEISLELCNHSAMEIPGCDNKNVVGLECKGDIIKIEPLFATRPYEGIVDGYHGDLRYDIIGNVSSTTAQTLCAMLGYGHVGFSGRAIPERYLDYFKKDVNCIGTESSISECVGDIEYCVDKRRDNCVVMSSGYKHVAVFCSAYKIQGLRLGPDGKLLMEINGRQWGSCIEYFSIQTAQSACRIMGYSGNVTFTEQTRTNDVEITGTLVCSANATTVENCELKHQFSYRPYRLDSACTQYVLLTCGTSNTGR